MVSSSKVYIMLVGIVCDPRATNRKSIESLTLFCPCPSFDSLKGKQDCAQIRNRFPPRRITDVVASPLARSIETSSEVFSSYLQRQPMTNLPDFVSSGDSAFTRSLGPIDLRLKFRRENKNYLYLGDNGNPPTRDSKEITRRVNEVKKHLQSLKPGVGERTREVVVVSHSSVLKILCAGK
jgi:broad specificity phosphatase PhoE